MTAQEEKLLTDAQSEAFRATLHHGATEASEALHRWIQRPTKISCDAIHQLPLREATSVLGEGSEPVCYCAVEMSGLLTGRVILAFDDASGLALADLLLGQPRGTARAWGEMETSAAIETTNILCCAYLNAIARVFPAEADDPCELMPTPPIFRRDFAESLLESALIGQIVANDAVLLARTQFQIDGSPVDWTLLFVPDATSMAKLRDVLP